MFSLRHIFAKVMLSLGSGGLLCISAFAADIKVRGLSAEDEEKILNQLRPRLEYILARPPSSWRADDTAFFLKRIMIRKGYADVKVEPQLPGNDLIEVFVNTGPRYRFGEIRSEKTVVSQELLREYFLQPLVDKEVVREDEAPYIQEYVGKGANNIKNYLRSIGYWNAEVTSNSEETDRENKLIHIGLTVQPGNQLIVAEPKFEGASEENLSGFQKKVQKFVGKTATTKTINRMRREVERYYEDNGYQFAKVSADVQHSETQSTLVFKINSGAQYKVNDTIVTGYEKTKVRKIRRYFKKEKGKLYNEAEISRITTRLINTGAFSSVVVNPTPLTDKSKALLDLNIEVTEAKARTLRAYTGFGSFEGGIIGVGYSDSNFFGALTKFFVGAEYSGRGLLGQVGINEQRVFNSPLDFNARTYLIERFNEGYDVRKFGLETNLTWALSDHFLSRLYWSGEYATSSSSNLSELELGPDAAVTCYNRNRCLNATEYE